jgi:hypothetical protein
MRTITTTGVVQTDHTMTVVVPPDIPPGPQTVVVVLENSNGVPRTPLILNLTPHQVGPTDTLSTYRREDLYGDGGR